MKQSRGLWLYIKLFFNTQHSQSFHLFPNQKEGVDISVFRLWGKMVSKSLSIASLTSLSHQWAYLMFIGTLKFISTFVSTWDKGGFRDRIQYVLPSTAAKGDTNLWGALVLWIHFPGVAMERFLNSCQRMQNLSHWGAQRLFLAANDKVGFHPVSIAGSRVSILYNSGKSLHCT